MKPMQTKHSYKWLLRTLTLLLGVILLAGGCARGDVLEGDSEEATGSAESEAPFVTETESETVKQTKKQTERETEEPMPENAVTYPLNSNTEGIKILGKRYLADDKQINCDWTCSGIEFVIDHEGGPIAFSVKGHAGSSYFRIWVDGEECINPVRKSIKTPYFTAYAAVNTLQTKGIEAGEHTVRIMKVTGHTLSRAQILSVTFAGTILTEKKPQDSDLYIEYVGDSICCAWGTIGSHKGDFDDQDGTLAYPYLVSEELGADYAVTALSGQGLLCGNPGMTDGYLYASPLRDKTDNGMYQFERKADIVVINIGTNDYSQNKGEANFETSYLSFLNTVRQKNGADCKIVCVYNMMNDTYKDAILSAVEDFGGEGNGVYVWKAKNCGGGHPTISQHAQYAEDLLTFMAQKGIVSGR
ncbi:MAG: hypothetical protein E7668_06060 [Ruminococcaceae bacterium]|nr:hypothetical protein [Oscillospiraceae bacterium]